MSGPQDIEESFVSQRLSFRRDFFFLLTRRVFRFTLGISTRK